jgi:hypothetical protein
MSNARSGGVQTELGLETTYGTGKGVSCKFPFKIGALRPAAMPKSQWPGLAAGAAIAGVPLWIGENVCGFDLGAKFENGKVVSAPELEWRVKWYCNWQLQGYGDLVVQVNPQELLLGMPEYALKHLGVHSFDFRWGNENKKLGYAVKDLAAARELRGRGYGMAPDPNDAKTVERIGKGTECEFQVHANSGAVPYDALMRKIGELRKIGAKRMSITIPGERPTDLARAIRFASQAKLDLLTIDATLEETVDLYDILCGALQRLQKRGDFVPDIAIEAAFESTEEKIRAFAMGAPYVKLASLVGAPLEKALQSDMSAEEREGYPEELREMLGDRVQKLPAGALGVYDYLTGLAEGLRNWLTRAQKASLAKLERSDVLLAAAGRKISEAEQEELTAILDGRSED